MTLQPIIGEIRKIYLYHLYGVELHYIRFLDADGKLIYEGGKVDYLSRKFIDSGYGLYEIILQQGERIIGFESRCVKGCADHSFF